MAPLPTQSQITAICVSGIQLPFNTVTQSTLTIPVLFKGVVTVCTFEIILNCNLRTAHASPTGPPVKETESSSQALIPLASRLCVAASSRASNFRTI
jgi:hypothetical protein